MKKYLLVTAALILLVVTLVSARSTSSSGGRQQAQTASRPSNKSQQFSLTDPASQWVIVNKQRPLALKTYTPGDLITPAIALHAPGDESMQLRAAAAKALEQLSAGASHNGLKLMLYSGYRSYDSQVASYQSEVNAYGQAIADQESARPGFSEHQTGWAADIEPGDQRCEAQDCFADTPEGKWLAANSYRYGFVIRYPAGKQSITGYKYEPWHIRYVGKELATNMQQKHNLTLEEYFRLPAAPNY